MDFTVSGIISGMFGMLKQRWAPMLGIWATYLGMIIALFIVMAIVIGASAAMLTSIERGGGLGALGAGTILMMIVFYLIFLAFLLAQSASLSHMASPLLQPNFGESLSAGFRAVPTLILVGLLYFVGYIVIVIVFAIIGAILSFAGKIGSFVAILPFLPVLIYLGCRLALVPTIAAVEQIGNPITVIQRSWRLSEGHVLTIFLASLVLGLIFVVLFGLAILPSIGTFMSAASGGTPNLGAIGVTYLGFLVIGVVAGLASAAMHSVMHAELSGSAGQNLGETFG